LCDYFIAKRTLKLCSIAVAHSIKKRRRVTQTSTEAHPFQITSGHQKQCKCHMLAIYCKCHMLAIYDMSSEGKRRIHQML